MYIMQTRMTEKNVSRNLIYFNTWNFFLQLAKSSVPNYIKKWNYPEYSNSAGENYLFCTLYNCQWNEINVEVLEHNVSWTKKHQSLDKLS